MSLRAERLFEALRELVAIQSVSPDATRARCAGQERRFVGSVVTS
jgi:hypothetical protein